MDDALYGTRDKRGDWKPEKLIAYPPVFVWPAKPLAFLKWLPGYIFPWNALYALISLAFWVYLTPSLETLRHFSPGWMAFLLLRNALLVLVFFGAFHVRLYTQKAQGTAFKYNSRWPATDNSAFLFKNQTIDNLIWTFASGVPIWTAYEIVSLWLFANGYIPYVSFADHPIYCVALLLLVPVLRDLHFYLAHRLIHAHAIYHSVHKLHHNNVNPGPWSGLAMHPIEHLIYFSVVIFHWIIPSHPLHAVYNLTHAALAPAPGHVGFDKVVVGEEAGFDTHSYAHYLHHKYFECNYSDGVIPIDKWFGTFHDGSKDAQARMDKRFMDRAAVQAARKAKREKGSASVN